MHSKKGDGFELRSSKNPARSPSAGSSYRVESYTVDHNHGRRLSTWRVLYSVNEAYVSSLAHITLDITTAPHGSKQQTAFCHSPVHGPLGCDQREHDYSRKKSTWQ